MTTRTAPRILRTLILTTTARITIATDGVCPTRTTSKRSRGFDRASPSCWAWVSLVAYYRTQEPWPSFWQRSPAEKLILGLFTVLVFSLGFASVLVVVGVVAASVGQLILAWLSSRWIAWVQIGAALLIVGVGLVLTANAWRNLAAIS